MATLLALCLAASVLTGCPVSKNEPNPDGINICPAGCTCIGNPDVIEVQCGDDMRDDGMGYQ